MSTVISERTVDNIKDWITVENIRLWLEALRDEHGPDHVIGERNVSQCYVAQFARSTLGDVVRECGYKEIMLSDLTVVIFSDVSGVVGAHPVSNFIRRVDQTFERDTPLTVQQGLNLLELEVMLTIPEQES